jgi:hypothetical protein
MLIFYFSQLSALLLRTVYKEPLFKRLEFLGAGLASSSTKHQLSPKLPVKRDVPVLLGLAIDDRVIVLQIGAAAGGLQRSPSGILVHSGSMLRPDGEVIRIERECLLELLDGHGVLEEENLLLLVSLVIS